MLVTSVSVATIWYPQGNNLLLLFIACALIFWLFRVGKFGFALWELRSALHSDQVRHALRMAVSFAPRRSLLRSQIIRINGLGSMFNELELLSRTWPCFACVHQLHAMSAGDTIVVRLVVFSKVRTSSKFCALGGRFRRRLSARVRTSKRCRAGCECRWSVREQQCWRCWRVVASDVSHTCVCIRRGTASGVAQA